MINTQLDTTIGQHAIADSQLQRSTSADKDQAWETAKKFEALLLQTMLKNMRAATPGDDLLNGEQAGLYMDMLDQTLSKEISQSSGLGLADNIYRQLIGQTATPDSNSRGSLPLTSPQSLQSGAILTNNNYATVKYNTPDGFVSRIKSAARQTADILGTSTAAVVAVAALETGWGKSVATQADGSSTHNLFGIKADSNWTGKSSMVPTHEFSNGVSHPQKAAFRVYGNEQQSIRDFGDFLLTNPRYQSALKSAADPEAFLYELQRAGYATDPDYANKAISIMHSIDKM